jgi:hypothetical protein
MTAPHECSQPKGETLHERLRTMPSSLNDACRTMDEAADRVEELEKALRAIDTHLDNFGYPPHMKARKLARAPFSSPRGRRYERAN